MTPKGHFEINWPLESQSKSAQRARTYRVQTWLGIFSSGSTFIKPVVCGVPPSKRKQKALVITLMNIVLVLGVCKLSGFINWRNCFMKNLQSICCYTKGKKNMIDRVEIRKNKKTLNEKIGLLQSSCSW